LERYRELREERRARRNEALEAIALAVEDQYPGARVRTQWVRQTRAALIWYGRDRLAERAAQLATVASEGERVLIVRRTSDVVWVPPQNPAGWMPSSEWRIWYRWRALRAVRESGGA